ncbi:MAG: hypothetical protein NWQ09_04575 [Nonlabens sp.]|nr:hypothetical protein [Nonlabens sp.]
MITDHKLLIDKHCPMCVGYSKVFTEMHMLDDSSIAPYQTIEPTFTQHIDMHRAQNEIALLDTVTNKTIYGLDAMFHIVAQNRKWIKQMLYFPLIHIPLKYLYKLITYNRKVIVGGTITQGTERSCNPDRNLFYRGLFILLSALFTAVVLNSFFSKVGAYFGFQSPWYMEYLVCCGQVVWQGMVLQLIAPKNTWDYLGNMSAVSTLGGMLLLPVLLLTSFVTISGWVLLGCFGIVVGVMLLEHIRRCKSMELGWWPTISWVVYRNLILLLFTLFVR